MSKQLQSKLAAVNDVKTQDMESSALNIIVVVLCCGFLPSFHNVIYSLSLVLTILI